MPQIFPKVADVTAFCAFGLFEIETRYCVDAPLVGENVSDLAAVVGRPGGQRSVAQRRLGIPVVEATPSASHWIGGKCQSHDCGLEWDVPVGGFSHLADFGGFLVVGAWLGLRSLALPLIGR